MPRPSTLPFALGVALLSLFVCAPASAQEEPAEAQQTAAARALFEQGLGRFDAGDLEGAESSFRESIALRASTSVLFNLAVVLERRGRLVEAREIFERVTRDADAPEALRGDAQSRLAEVGPRLAHIVVRTEVEGASFSVDDATFGAAVIGAPVPVDPGPHRVVLRRGAEVLDERAVTLAEAETSELVLAARPAPTELVVDDPPAVAPSPPASAGVEPWPFVVLGVGVATLAAGAVTGALAFSARDRLQSERCGGGFACAPGYEAELDEARTLATVTDVLLIAGATVAAAGLVWLIVALAEGGAEERAALDPTVRF